MEMKKTIAISILLIFSLECAGIEHLPSTLHTKGNTLRPVATLRTGLNTANDAENRNIKASSSGRQSQKFFKTRTKKKGKPEPERETSALNALIFVAGTALAFYGTSKITGNPLIIFAVTVIAAGGILAIFGMLKDVLLFIPRKILDRRKKKAEELIKEGRVKVNNKIISLGDKASEDDNISVDGKLVRKQKMVCLMFHKPVGCITALRDTQYKTIMDYIKINADYRS